MLAAGALWDACSPRECPPTGFSSSSSPDSTEHPDVRGPVVVAQRYRKGALRVFRCCCLWRSSDFPDQTSPCGRGPAPHLGSPALQLPAGSCTRFRGQEHVAAAPEPGCNTTHALHRLECPLLLPLMPTLKRTIPTTSRSHSFHPKLLK